MVIVRGGSRIECLACVVTDGTATTNLPLLHAKVRVSGFSGMGIVEWWNSGMVERWNGGMDACVVSSTFLVLLLKYQDHGKNKIA